jgi:hypothetical protein
MVSWKSGSWVRGEQEATTTRLIFFSDDLLDVVLVVL